VPIFRAKALCPNCGAEVKQPRDPQNYLCPSCWKPGPWASPEQRSLWEREEEEKKRRAAEEAERARLAELARQEARRRQLEQAASLTPIEVPGFISQKGEHAYLTMSARLGEWKKQRGHYEGGQGIRGLSIKVPGTKSMRAYYGGLSPRTYVPGEEGWQLTDEGTAIITSKRVVFRGTSRAVEWAFAKLIGVDADRSNSCLILQVSNRQRANVLQLADLEVFVAAFEAVTSDEPDESGSGEPTALGPPPRPDEQPALGPPPRPDVT
jgi:hypothetical protein